MGLKVFVHGGGAVGAVLGWRMAQKGAQVTVSCRSNYDVVRRSGFLIKSASWGEGKFIPNYTVRHPSERPFDHYDYVLVTTKLATRISSIVKDLAPVVSAGTTLCSAQNGISADRILSSAFPRNPILSAICYISINQKAPGYITQDATVGLKPWAFGVGIHSGGQPAEASLKRLLSMDSEFQLAAEGTDKARWEKMIFNAAWNPACAILGLDSMRMLQHPLGIPLVRALAGEAYNVARARGINLNPSVVDQTAGWAAKHPRSEMIPSMLRDVQANKPVEVEGLCGALVNLARDVGVAVPTITAVERILSAKNDALARHPRGEVSMPPPPAFPEGLAHFGNRTHGKSFDWGPLLGGMPAPVPLTA